MRHTPHRTPARRLLALLAVAGLLLAACGNSGDDDEDASTDDTTATTEADDGGDEGEGEGDIEVGEFQPIEGVPGVTDDEISFGLLSTGPANPLGYCLLECYQAGVEAYFEWRNSEGGVHGRDLVISRVEDDEFGNTQVKLLELAEDDTIFGLMAAPQQYNGYADVGNTDLPIYTTFPASPESDGFDNIYPPTGVICIDCITPVGVQEAKLVGASTVASLGFGISQASKDCAAGVQEAVEKFGPGAGLEFGYLNNELPFGFPNGVGPEVTAMKDAGVDFIDTCIDQGSALSVEQELERQGLGDDVAVSLPQGYGDAEFLATNADLLEGDILGLPYRPIEADQDGTIIPTMLEYLEKGGHVNDYAIQGWIGADLAVEGLLAAGPDFDRAKVIEATNQITDFTAGGLLQPVDWTTAHTKPEPDSEYRACSTYLRVRGGELELEGDPAKPFFCWEMPLDEYVEPEQVG